MTAVSDAAFDDTLSKLAIARTAGASGAPKVQTAAEAQTLGQDSFLKLMTEQLKNQDPFEPVKNDAMVAQMAQFSSVAGISEMNTTLKSMVTRMDASSTSTAIGYVGKTVLIEGDTAFANKDGSLDAVLPLSDATGDVQVSISDQAGNVLRTLTLGAQPKGDLSIVWDGKTDSGSVAPEGPYKLKASVLQGTTRVAAPIEVWAPVTSVSLPPDGSMAQLNLAGLGQKPMNAVRQVG